MSETRGEYGEPWEVYDDAGLIGVRTSEPLYVGFDYTTEQAERVVACVNAMEGIRNTAPVQELVEACRALRVQYEQRGTFSENGFKIIEIVRALDREPEVGNGK